MSKADLVAHTVSLEEKVAFLTRPAAYPGGSPGVRAIQTHMSWLFLAGELAYKLKKPVRYPFLDFTTLGRRRRWCEAELRLNRRLAGEVYRRVVPLTLEPSGDLRIEGSGRVVEWLLEMQQLSSDRMLDVALTTGLATRDDIATTADVLARFYGTLRSERRRGRMYLAHLRDETRISHAVLMRPELQIAPGMVEEVLGQLEHCLGHYSTEIGQRIERGLVREGHGDLRPEHVWLGPPPRVIDCLEFARSMRLLDPYDEANYLGLECEMLDSDWVRPVLLAALDRVLDDPPSPGLLATYGAFRAVLRARICMAHLLDPEPARPERWPPKARHYLEIARRECLIAEGAAVD